MIDKKYDNLNLLPIDTEVFFAAGDTRTSYSTSVTGTYGQGTFPASRYVRVTVSCLFEPCLLVLGGPDYIFQGISNSSSTFSLPTISFAFNSTIPDTGNTNYPYDAIYTLNSTQTNLINQLAPGTYYVWFDGASRWSLTITSTTFSSNVSIKCDFVVNK